jgi:hydroxymethylbilane synthase
MELEPGFALAAILARADHADAFVSNRFDGLAALPHGARVGTSSLRRQAQLRAARPDLQLLDLRGNVNTRLAKLDAGDYDAIVLACAGLQRLGFDARIRARLAAPRWLPAPAQGAIAIECRDGDAATQALCAVLDHADTRTCTGAERAMNRALHGSCHVPVAAYARLDGPQLLLDGLVGSAADGTLVRAHAAGPGDAPDALGLQVAQQLLDAGAGMLLPPH